MSPMSRTVSLLVLALVPAMKSASAQSFNVDIGDQPPFSLVPSPAFGAGAGQPGFWNSVSPAVAVPAALNDLNGLLSGVSLAHSGGTGTLNVNDPLTFGEDEAVMDDAQGVGSVGTTTTWTFANLASGTYNLFTYAWTPGSPTARTSVSGGTVSPQQTCGGAWPGLQQQGVTYTVHHFTISGGSPIAITVTTTVGFGAIGGMQLVQLPPPGTYFCFGDGSGTACPAGNNSPVGAGEGCLNSLGVGGLIDASGMPSISADTLLFHGSHMTTGPCLYYQGTAQIAGGAGAVFGDGLRCAGGSVVRLAIKFNGHGSSEYPEPGDQPVSVKGMVTPGFRYYEVWYRDAVPFGTTATFNTTRTVCIPWVP